MTTSWSTTDNLNVTLSNRNLTATATSTAYGAGRTNNSFSTGKKFFELYLGAAPDSGFSFGLANSSWNIYATVGQGNPSNSIGIFAGDIQEIIFNNVYQGTSGTNPCPSGNYISCAVDFGNSLFWVTTDQMRTDTGAAAWNHSLSANPATGAGGISFSGLTGPLFVAWETRQSGMPVTLNVGATSFHVSVPSGFTSLDGAIVGSIGVNLAPATLAATGAVGISGAINSSLAPATLAATGTVNSTTIIGILAPQYTPPNPFSNQFSSQFGGGPSITSLAPATLSAVGIVSSTAPTYGQIVATLAPATLAASGTVTTVGAVGTITTNLATATLSAVGYVGTHPPIILPIVTWID